MVSLLTYILVAVFGSSSWLSTNSVWMELSLMVANLPEGWTLPSYLSAVVQLACVGPLLYSVLHKCTNFDIPKAPVIQGLLILCTGCSLAMAFLWDKTTVIFGTERSICLIIIMFFMALVNATSNVLFMPYMATFHPTYLTAYFVGMGLSSLIPSIFSLIQGTGTYECLNKTGIIEPHYLSPNFTVQGYNIIMFAWLSLTVVSFALLHWGRHLIQREKSQTQSNNDTSSDAPADEFSPLNTQQTLTESEMGDRTSFTRYCILLGCLAFICAQMNGVVPNIQSYSALPYSQLTYHLALALGNLAQAVACFIPLWIQPRSIPILSLLTVIASGFCGYIVLLAAQSPTPLLLQSFWGGFLSVFASIAAASLHAYLRTVFTSVIREDNPDSESRLFWCGVFMQIGSFIGTTIMFPLVNVAHLFQSAPACG
uniref:Riboflavin transporter n=1 Tax=Panagrolaimus sp. ES5 TaxID=591445 RepID=A0AC34F2A0_9BILA